MIGIDIPKVRDTYLSRCRTLSAGFLGSKESLLKQFVSVYLLQHEIVTKAVHMTLLDDYLLSIESQGINKLIYMHERGAHVLPLLIAQSQRFSRLNVL